MPRLFGAKLRYLRLQNNVTQAELARQLGTKRAHINNVEAERRAASLDLVTRAATCFGVTIDYFLRDTIPIDTVQSAITPATPRSGTHYRLFGQKLRYLRTRRNLTQSDVAAQLALASHSHISFLEIDKKEPSPELVIQIADLFQVTTDYLLRDAIPVELADELPGNSDSSQ